MRNSEDHHYCPLFKREVYWGDCWIVQDVRDDNTDMEFAPEQFKPEQAQNACEKCRWYDATKD